jgi:hypothetical protein
VLARLLCMSDAVTILHVGAPQSHASPAWPTPARVNVDWRLLHADSPMVSGSWHQIALPLSIRASAFEALLEGLGFSSVTAGYLTNADPWPAEIPIPGYVRPASAAGGATVSPSLRPASAMVTARAVWSGAAVQLGHVGVDPHAMVLRYEPHAVQPRSALPDGSAVLLPNGLWLAAALNPSGGQVMGNSPSEVAAKLKVHTVENDRS